MVGRRGPELRGQEVGVGVAAGRGLGQEDWTRGAAWPRDLRSLCVRPGRAPAPGLPRCLAVMEEAEDAGRCLFWGWRWNMRGHGQRLCAGKEPPAPPRPEPGREPAEPPGGGLHGGREGPPAGRHRG